MEKLISIVMPAYNAAALISETIESILNQTYQNWELIIVNDGSKDDTLKVCRQFADKDDRIIVIDSENSGVSMARNKAIAACKGEYITFIDSDDLYVPEFLSVMSELVADQSVDMGCCGYSMFGSQGENLGKECPENRCVSQADYYVAIHNLLETKCFNILWNKIFKREIIADNNIKMDSKVSMGEDLLFVIDYMKFMSGKLLVTDKALYKYRLNPLGLQASTKTDNYDRRIEQWHQLGTLYRSFEFPVENLDEELMRIIYTSLMEAVETKNIDLIKMIIQSPEYGVVLKSNAVGGRKNKAFKAILKTRNVTIISIGIHIFKLMKTLQGKRIKW